MNNIKNLITSLDNLSNKTRDVIEKLHDKLGDSIDSVDTDILLNNYKKINNNLYNRLKLLSKRQSKDVKEE